MYKMYAQKIMDRAKRIEQLKSGLKWFSEQPTDKMVRIGFNVYASDISDNDKDGYRRWVKLNDDISEIYMSGTQEEKAAIDNICEKFDLDYRRKTNEMENTCKKM